MCNSMKTLIALAALVAGLGITATSSAHETKGSRGSMMGPGMMGQGGMMGMMNMMGQMSQMMEHCNQMKGGMMDYRGSGQPNEQWRREQRDAPKTPEKEG